MSLRPARWVVAVVMVVVVDGERAVRAQRERKRQSKRGGGVTEPVSEKRERERSGGGVMQRVAFETMATRADRDTERHRETQRDTERHRDTEAHRDTERHRGTERRRVTETQSKELGGRGGVGRRREGEKRARESTRAALSRILSSPPSLLALSPLLLLLLHARALIIARGHYSEKDAAHLLHDVVNAIGYLPPTLLLPSPYLARCLRRRGSV
eukprot:1928116-Rhodomonas_salina.1